MRKFIIIIFVILFAVAVILIIKSAKMEDVETLNSVDTTDTTSTASSSVSVSVEKDEVVPNVVEIVVKGGNFLFAPNSIKVKQGDKVNINFINDEGFHDLKIDEYAVATKILKKGESEVVSFIADKKGSFEYYCSVGTHRQMGMTGTLVVE